MDLLGKKVLVAGCGKSGLGAAGLLQKAGAVPVLFDENEKLDGKALCAREDYPKDTALVLGSLPKELLSELSLAVLSPGISIEEAFVSTLEEADIPVWGEIELAWNYEKGKVLDRQKALGFERILFNLFCKETIYCILQLVDNAGRKCPHVHGNRSL